jgi:hypothetical protein
MFVWEGCVMEGYSQVMNSMGKGVVREPKMAG